jgi:ATP-dependent RNA helicase DDX31/DBP7
MATHLTNKLSITAPTAIQKTAIPVLIQGDSDAFIQAQTGSGKTLAYLLPIIDRILKLSPNEPTSIHRGSGLFAIILAPTRELCKQISVVLESALRFAPGVVAGMVMGGEKKKSEKARLRKGLNILVATPGRLADHFDHTEVLDVSSVRWLVLDEGDRLMELGFEEDITRILSRLDFRLKNPKGQIIETLPKKRISILCSATLRTDVQKLGDISLKDAHHITTDASEANEDLQQTSTLEKKFTVPSQLKQTYIIVPAKLRLVSLQALLNRNFYHCLTTTKVIVFFSCADSVDFHFQVFSQLGHDITEGQSKNNMSDNDLSKQHIQNIGGDILTSSAAPSISTTLPVTVFRLHGSLVQSVRTSTLSAFSKCQTPALLLCTDIASRGLDLPHVDRVIEYDAAFSREEHLHRVGRTARAGNYGYASVFLMPGSEEGYINVLKEERGQGEGTVNIRGQSVEQILQAAFVDRMETAGSTTSFIKEGRGFGDDNLQPWEKHATIFQLQVERWALENPLILESGRRAFQSHIRAYATHVKEERKWFDLKQLHLGHLAKAFGLRDRPGNVNVPGMRSSASQVKTARRKAGGSANQAKHIDPKLLDSETQPDVNVSKAKLRKMGMMTGRADEFNLA